MIGLDTAAIIDIFKGEQGIKIFLEKSKEPLASNMMNYTEIFLGIDSKNSIYSEEAKYYHEFFKNIYFTELTKEACRKASSIYWDLKKKGKPIGKFDCMLASCFLEKGVNKILTRNTKHFQGIKELKVLSY